MSKDEEMIGIACQPLLLAALLCLVGIVPPAVDAELAPDCPGDCDGNGAVTIDELIRGVRLALGSAADECLSSFDRDADGRAEVAELLLGVRSQVAGCDQPLTFVFDFAGGALGWGAGFADYPAGEEQLYELEQGIRPLPDELGASASGFLLSGNNHSDDLFMFLARRLGREDGVAAGQAYEVSFDIRFASNAPSGCAGIGGAPGESVFFKAGASGIEPLAVPGGKGLLVLNVDKGNQGSGGTDVSLAGNIANGIPCELDVPYVSLRRSHTHPSPVTASDVGEIWLLVGTDSGFEGTTALYYEAVEVSLSPTDETPAPTFSPTPTIDASETPTPTPGCAIAVDRKEIHVPGCSRPENLRGTLRVSTSPSDCCWDAFSNGLVVIEPTQACGDTEVSYVIRENDGPLTRGVAVYFSAGAGQLRTAVGFTQSRGCTPTRSATRTQTLTPARTTTAPSPTITRTRTCTPGHIFPPTPGCSYEGPTFTRTASRTPTRLPGSR